MKTCIPAFVMSLFFVLWSGCGGGGSGGPGGPPGADSGPQTTAVKWTEVQPRSISFYREFPATVTPLEEVQIRPQVAGYVTAIHYQEGNPVRRGQKLFTIDNRRYQAGVEQAEAAIKTAEANLALAETDVARYRRLDSAEAIAKQTLDRAEAEVEARRQDLAAARAQRSAAQTELDYAVIRAPLSGLTDLTAVEVGTQVSPGAPVLTMISQEDPVGVDVAVAQEYIPRLSRYQNTATPDSLLRLFLPDGSRYAYPGRIYALDRRVDPRTGTITVRLKFPNPDGVLRAGMNCRLALRNELSGEQLLVPTTALREEMGEFFVFLAGQGDSLALRQKVITGPQVDSLTVIRRGVDAGQRVIYSGTRNLRDSSRIQLASSTAPSPGGANSQ